MKTRHYGHRTRSKDLGPGTRNEGDNLNGETEENSCTPKEV